MSDAQHHDAGPRMLQSGERARLALGVFIAVWALMGAGDWFMRFAWFRWHASLVLTSGTTSVFPSKPMQDRDVPASSGGDLSRMLGIPEVAKDFEQPRIPYRQITDEFGFRNVPPTQGRSFPLVVVGDSFAGAGDSVTNTLSGELASVSGLDAYGYAYAGRGVLFPMIRFFQDERFRAQPPRVVVWGLLERDISGKILSALPFYLDQVPAADSPAAPVSRFNWSALAPATLGKSLPSSSALALVGDRAWNRIRFSVFGELTPDVRPSEDLVVGRRMLFESFALRALTWPREELRPDLMAAALADLSKRLADRGVRLVVLLIPTKERVYEALLPVSDAEREAFQPSTLFDIEALLREQQVGVVNLLPVFSERAGRGEQLYWADDTHWNQSGIRLAAEATWAAVRSDVRIDGGSP